MCREIDRRIQNFKGNKIKCTELLPITNRDSKEENYFYVDLKKENVVFN